MSWGYELTNGPPTWVREFPIAAGEQQSPIDIVTSNAKYDKALADKPLTITYAREPNMELTNTGHSVKAQIRQQGSGMTGGPLSNFYRLEQFHLHWGANDDRGSEHTIDGRSYAAELHLVHFNTKYKNFGEAADKPDGLAVLGIMLKVGQEHLGFASVTDKLVGVIGKGRNTNCGTDFDPACLLPKNTKDYWTYPGSLTTPPLFESVRWIVFKEPIEVSSNQMSALRSLNTDDSGSRKMIDNFRPPQPIKQRTVSASFN